MLYVVICYFFFFFQAEDGIRDGTVTGVQTCALPILEIAALDDVVHGFGGRRMQTITRSRECCRPDVGRLRVRPVHDGAVKEEQQRSEERRVGKECRSRWSTYH